MRLLPFVLAAAVVLTLYAMWLRRRYQPVNPVATPAARVRSRATVVDARIRTVLTAAEAARLDAADRAPAPALRELERALTAGHRDAAGVERLLDLVGGGRDDLDGMLEGATDRAADSLTQLRHATRAVDAAIRTLPGTDVETRVAAAERLATDVHLTWEDESARTEAHGSRFTPGARLVPRADLEYAQRLLDGAVEACASARTLATQGETGRAVGRVEAAESLAEEAAELLLTGRDRP